MHRLSRGILIGVVLFVVVMVSLLIARGRSVTPDIQEATTTPADYRIKEIYLQEEAKDGVRWELSADQAEVYEQLGKTIMKRVTITIEQPERTWTVTGDEGDLAQTTKDVEIRGNVVLTANDGLRLETSRLHWAANEQRAWTDEPVTIYRPGAVVRGQGLEAHVKEHRTAVKGRVHATFTNGGGAGTAPEVKTGQRGEASR